MLRGANELMRNRLETKDGELAHLKDFYFDDHAWTVRYAVAAMGGWMSGRRALIRPAALEEPDLLTRTIRVALSKEQLEQCPSSGSDRPVSRQYEEKLILYRDWPRYWAPAGTPTTVMMPEAIPSLQLELEDDPRPEGDPSLRSVKEVEGYHIHAADGEIGHVEDFIVDTNGWVVRYMAIDTRNWLPGKKVLISPVWTDRISWAEKRVEVSSFTRQRIKDAPEYDPQEPVRREYESRLCEHYGRPKYWEPPGGSMS